MNNSPTFWIWMRDNFHCLYFCTQTVADGKRCFHSEQQHRPSEHYPPKQSRFNRLHPPVPLCLTRTDVEDSSEALIFSRLPTSLQDPPRQRLSYSFQENLSSPTVCSNDAQFFFFFFAEALLHCPSRALRFTWGGSLVENIVSWIFYPGCFRTKPRPDLPRQKPFTALSLPHSHILYVTTPLPTLRGKQSSLRAPRFYINHT